MRERPACVDQMGAIKCACDLQRPPQRAACTANRYFYIHLETIVKAASNAIRNKLVSNFERSHSFVYAAELRAAARAELAAMAERDQVNQLKTQASAAQPKGSESRRHLASESKFSVTPAAQAEA